MFYYKFFCQTIQCPKKEGGGRIPPPSDVSPTEKHADVTRVKVSSCAPDKNFYRQSVSKSVSHQNQKILSGQLLLNGWMD